MWARFKYESIGGICAGGAEEDPQELVPDEKRERAQLGLDPGVAADPHQRDDRQEQQDAGDRQQTSVGRRRGVVINVSRRVVILAVWQEEPLRVMWATWLKPIPKSTYQPAHF